MTLPVFWLSFSCETGFLGACVVRAISPIAAVARAEKEGCNPGGEVLIWGPLPMTDEELPPFELNRLYSKQEIDDRGGATKVDYNGNEIP